MEIFYTSKVITDVGLSTDSFHLSIDIQWIPQLFVNTFARCQKLLFRDIEMQHSFFVS